MSSHPYALVQLLRSPVVLHAHPWSCWLLPLPRTDRSRTDSESSCHTNVSSAHKPLYYSGCTSSHDPTMILGTTTSYHLCEKRVTSSTFIVRKVLCCCGRPSVRLASQRGGTNHTYGYVYWRRVSCSTRAVLLSCTKVQGPWCLAGIATRRPAFFVQRTASKQGFYAPRRTRVTR